MASLDYLRHLVSYVSNAIKPSLQDEFKVKQHKSSAFEMQGGNRPYLEVTPKHISISKFEDNDELEFHIAIESDDYKLYYADCCHTYTCDELNLLADKIISTSKMPQYQEALAEKRFYYYAHKNKLPQIKKMPALYSDEDKCKKALETAIKCDACPVVRFLGKNLYKLNPSALDDVLFEMFQHDISLECFKDLSKINNDTDKDASYWIDRAIDHSNRYVAFYLLERNVNTSEVSASNLYYFCSEIIKFRENKTKDIKNILRLGLAKNKKTLTEVFKMMADRLDDSDYYPVIRHTVNDLISTDEQLRHAKDAMSEICVSYLRQINRVKNAEQRNAEQRNAQNNSGYGVKIKKRKLIHYKYLYNLFTAKNIFPDSAQAMADMIAIESTSPVEYIQKNNERLNSQEKALILEAINV